MLKPFLIFVESPGNIRKALINSSLIEQKAIRDDVKAYYVPANKIANEIGNGKVALRKLFGSSKEHSIQMNMEALKKVLLQ